MRTTMSSLQASNVSSPESAQAWDPSHVASKCRIVETIVVRNVADQFADNDSVNSAEFFCPRDKSQATFELELRFYGTTGTVGAFLKAVDTDVSLTLLKFVLRDENVVLAEQKYDYSQFHLSKNELRGFPEFYKLDDVHDVASASTWRVTCEFIYETMLQETEASSGSSLCKNLKVHKDLLKMLEEPTNSDVTFLVRGERILAHKAILSARSQYFKAMFTSDVRENNFNEVDVPDVEPRVFTGLLQFLYSGLPPANLDEIAMDLIVVADKYCFEEMVDVSAANVSKNLNANNVIDALLVADKINREDLMKNAKVVFRSSVDSFQQNGDAMQKLKTSPDLMADLLLHYCRE